MIQDVTDLSCVAPGTINCSYLLFDVILIVSQTVQRRQVDSLLHFLKCWCLCEYYNSYNSFETNLVDD